MPNNWWAGEWGNCDEKCEKNRTVKCRSPQNIGCPVDKKPLNRRKCCTIKYVSNWSSVSTQAWPQIERQPFSVFVCSSLSLLYYFYLYLYLSCKEFTFVKKKSLLITFALCSFRSLQNQKQTNIHQSTLSIIIKTPTKHHLSTTINTKSLSIIVKQQ